MKRVYVSAHAIIRYMERIERVDLRPLRRAAKLHGVDTTDDSHFVAFLNDYTSVDVAATRRKMTTAAVRSAATAGATSVLVSGARLVLKYEGVAAYVVSVVPGVSERCRPIVKPRPRRDGAWRVRAYQEAMP